MTTDTRLPEKFYPCNCIPDINISTCLSLEPCENGVAIAIGMQNKTIPDQYITASSSHYNARPYEARLERSGGWSASYQVNQWLQVNVGKIAKVNISLRCNNKR